MEFNECSDFPHYTEGRGEECLTLVFWLEPREGIPENGKEKMGVWNSFGKKTLSSILNIKNPQSLRDIQGQVFTELLTAWSRPPRSSQSGEIFYKVSGHR